VNVGVRDGTEEEEVEGEGAEGGEGQEVSRESGVHKVVVLEKGPAVEEGCQGERIVYGNQRVDIVPREAHVRG
jgi:hypothetical protein